LCDYRKYAVAAALRRRRIKGGEQLQKHDSQLFRYFGTTTAKFGILTNGVVYRFYSDLDEKNKMDLAPFLEIDLLNLRDTLVPELKKFCKDVFDADTLYSSASDLKYTNNIRAYFQDQLNDPNDEFIRFVTSKVYEGKVMSSVLERFKPLVKTTLDNYITELLNERIQGALKQTKEPEKPIEPPVAEIPAEPAPKIVTTEEEIQGFYIIKGLLASDVDMSRITYKDTMSYFAVLLDGKVTRWICRLRVQGAKKTISFPDEQGDEVKTEINTIEDIGGFKDALVASVQRLLK